MDYPGGARIKRYEVVDQLDKRIKKDALTPVVKIVGQNETPLADTTDYTLITAEGADHNWATIQLTEEVAARPPRHVTTALVRPRSR